ncbi:MAG: winged helix-turn-helix domain-containing protein, partial [Actinobacteria bacterium]|nr:winged helix-turn-helix domain-containing protein [Actinomycetota bacterium]
AGSDVWLTRRDWQVLLALARAEGRVVSRDALYREVWGAPIAGHRDRSLDVDGHVANDNLLHLARKGIH